MWYHDVPHHRGVQVAVLTRVLRLLPLQNLKYKYSLIVFNNKLLRTNNNFLIVRVRLLLNAEED